MDDFADFMKNANKDSIRIICKYTVYSTEIVYYCEVQSNNYIADFVFNKINNNTSGAILKLQLITSTKKIKPLTQPPYDTLYIDKCITLADTFIKTIIKNYNDWYSIIKNHSCDIQCDHFISEIKKKDYIKDEIDDFFDNFDKDNYTLTFHGKQSTLDYNIETIYFILSSKNDALGIVFQIIYNKDSIYLLELKSIRKFGEF